MTQTTAIGAGLPAQAQAAQSGGGVSSQDRAALEKAARGFEAIFVRQLLSTMRKASMGEEIDGGSSVEQFRELSDANLANGLAQQHSLGIADLILKQLDQQAGQAS